MSRLSAAQRAFLSDWVAAQVPQTAQTVCAHVQDAFGVCYAPHAGILALAAFVQLAASCGPSVHVDTLASETETETETKSRYDPLAIHDNVMGETFHPATIAEAIRIATDLVTTGRHSTDLGLMQVNSVNLPALGLALPDAFDACRNIAAGARILAESYRSPPAG